MGKRTRASGDLRKENSKASNLDQLFSQHSQLTSSRIWQSVASIPPARRTCPILANMKWMLQLKLVRLIGFPRALSHQSRIKASVVRAGPFPLLVVLRVHGKSLPIT